ncbi:MAG: MFS transporter [bacterium]|nr:MFS transporter [bacterium]
MKNAKSEIASDSNRNFILGVLNGTIYNFSDSLRDRYFVIPVFLLLLTDSKILIGIASAVIIAGWYLPQAFFTKWTYVNHYKMPLYRVAAYIRIFSWCMITATVCLIGKIPDYLVLILFFICLLLAYGTGGLAGIPFMDIVAKTIDQKKRSSFFAYRFITGGILSFLAGFAVKFILSENSPMKFPLNFCILFFISTIFTAVAFFIFFGVKEPPSNNELKKNIIGKNFYKDAWKTLIQDFNFRNFYLYRFFLGIGLMSIPFIIPLGIEKLGIEKSDAGIFLAVSAIIGIFSNIWWKKISEKKGSVQVQNITAVLLITLTGIILIAIALDRFLPELMNINIAVINLNPSQLLLSLSAFMISSLVFSDGMGYYNYLLEMAPENKREIYVGFINTLNTPILLLPILGGVISKYSFGTLFILAFTFSIAAFFISKKLKEFSVEPGY